MSVISILDRNGCIKILVYYWIHCWTLYHDSVLSGEGRQSKKCNSYQRCINLRCMLKIWMSVNSARCRNRLVTNPLYSGSFVFKSLPGDQLFWGISWFSLVPPRKYWDSAWAHSFHFITGDRPAIRHYVTWATNNVVELLVYQINKTLNPTYQANVYYAPWSIIYFRSSQSCNWSRNFPTFMVPEGSLSCAQEYWTLCRANLNQRISSHLTCTSLSGFIILSIYTLRHPAVIW
jgi:hypothetical protein